MIFSKNLLEPSLGDLFYSIDLPPRTYEIHGGEKWAPILKLQFPPEHRAIDKFMELVNDAYDWRFSLLPAKMLPLWMIKLPLFLKVFSLITSNFERFRGVTIKDVVEGLTNDEDLREVLAYRWNVLVVAPNELPFTVHGGFEPSVRLMNKMP